MARKKVHEEAIIDVTEILTNLVLSYAKNNGDLSKLKKVCDGENKQLKLLMSENLTADEENKRFWEAGDYVATLALQDRSSMDEEKLIQWLKDNGFAKGVVKKKEYIDSDALENAIYNKVIPEDKVADMSTCKVENFVQVLTVKKKSKKEA